LEHRPWLYGLGAGPHRQPRRHLPRPSPPQTPPDLPQLSTRSRSFSNRRSTPAWLATVCSGCGRCSPPCSITPSRKDSSSATWFARPATEGRQRARGPALDEEQARAFLRAAAGRRLEAAFVLMLTVGLRPGEVLCLEWPTSTRRLACCTHRTLAEARAGRAEAGPDQDQAQPPSHRAPRAGTGNTGRSPPTPSEGAPGRRAGVAQPAAHVRDRGRDALRPEQLPPRLQRHLRGGGARPLTPPRASPQRRLAAVSVGRPARARCRRWAIRRPERRTPSTATRCSRRPAAPSRP
jgi:hypothetical protein